MSSTADVIRAMEEAWLAIQGQHPDLPPVVIVVAPTSKGGKLTRLGHFAARRWHGAGDERWAEVLVSAESLQNPAERVFTTLLHEAAHALADAKGIQDTSRNGVYHNGRFKETAEAMGCHCEKGGRIGWTTPGITGETASRYRSHIDDIKKAIKSWRGIEAPGLSTAKQPTKGVCGCGRILRMSPKVWEQGPVSCGVCGTDFEEDA